MGNGDPTSSSKGYNTRIPGDEDSFLSSYNNFNKRTNFLPSSPYFHHHQSLNSGINSQISSGISLQPSSGYEKLVFTPTQWQELERQTMIYKYIMASVPIPPQLLVPLSTQSNKVGIDLRFSSGSDPEPWRCRRTDGKKWRCSRDVAPDMKYCERHVHKSRPRSRKLVEIQSHNSDTATTNTAAVTGVGVTPTFKNPDMLPSSGTSLRCNEWFMKSGITTTPIVSSSNQQSMDSPRIGSKRNHGLPQDFESQVNPYKDNLDLDASVGARRQNFIDAWSRSGGGGDSCSLTLSMQCSGGSENIMIDNDESFRSNNQWLNQGWMGSPPGGPLAEALGLGVSGSVKRVMNVASSHGHNTSTTTSGSCELSFIR